MTALNMKHLSYNLISTGLSCSMGSEMFAILDQKAIIIFDIFLLL